MGTELGHTCRGFWLCLVTRNTRARGRDRWSKQRRGGVGRDLFHPHLTSITSNNTIRYEWPDRQPTAEVGGGLMTLSAESLTQASGNVSARSQTTSMKNHFPSASSPPGSRPPAAHSLLPQKAPQLLFFTRLLGATVEVSP